MLDITVQRNAGQHSAPDLSDPLITNVPVAISRARAELDASTSVRKLRIVCTFQPTLRLGQLMALDDSLRGETARGKVVGIEHVATDGALLTHIDLEVPATQR
ncbi:hypothetical protein [Chitinibacter sp. GC72]|uniref:hypothetical protein n=1 Tax=Chitinibacter sp. GC72 TaxID=1526917 RepID=UPI0012F857A9|nr:hypothetical protein [Chitinibacter sp. GC72]